MGTLRLYETRHRTHDRLAPGIDLIRAKDHTRPVSRRWLHDELAVEALTSAEPLVGDLMADRARDAVGGKLLQLAAVGLVERQVCEHFAFAARCARDLRRHRHVTFGAFVLNRRRMHWMI